MQVPFSTVGALHAWIEVNEGQNSPALRPAFSSIWGSCHRARENHHPRCKIAGMVSPDAWDLPCSRTRDPYAIWVSEIMRSKPR